MYHIETVEVANCPSNLSEIKRSQALLAVVFVSNFLEKTSMSGKLKQKIDFAAI
jgi:hypothetical protein